MAIQKAIADYVWIYAEKKEEVSEGGIILASKKPQHDRGVVAKVGQGCHTETGMLIPCEIKEGDLVIFEPINARRVTESGVNYFVVKERECYGVLEQ